MGKTAFVLSMARNTAVQFDKGVAVFSLEMASVQLVNRLISGESRIPAEKLRKGDLADHEVAQLHKRIGKLSKAPIYIDDTPALSVFELRAKCRRLKAQHDIQMVIIDYLQLMTAAGMGAGNREQEISTISRSIKSIAKELNVPIIALSQLSRSVETRGGDKRPMLSDLRESGAIEQDAEARCSWCCPVCIMPITQLETLRKSNVGFWSATPWSTFGFPFQWAIITSRGESLAPRWSTLNCTKLPLPPERGGMPTWK